jgi:KDO2-lipid IV(A) lauroyltransferase
MSGRDGIGRRLLFAVELAAAKLFQGVAKLVPSRLLIPACGRLGAFLARWLPVARRRIDRNLALVRPDMAKPERDALARAVGDNFGRLLAEYSRMPELAGDPDLYDVEGAEHLANAARAGKGVVLVTAHFGNWEIVRFAARRLGTQVAIIYRAFNNPGFDAIAQTYVSVAGTPVLHKGRKGSRELMRHVMKGGAAMILIDQRQTGAPLIPFLGVEAETATSAAALALRTGAALIPARAIRLPDGRRFQVSFEPPVAHDNPLEMTRALNDRISAWIAAHPGQWFWLHRRWRHGALGEARRAAGEAARK